MTFPVLSDADVARTLAMSDAIRKIEDAFRERAEGTFVAPPRFHVAVERGALVFTAGAATKREKVIGFRVYGAFPDGSPDAAQLVGVFDSDTGDLKGIIIGHRIGAMRTGAIGGVAIKHMARPDSRILGVLGSGLQARSQLEAAVSVCSFETIKVYSPTIEHREAFAAEMAARLHRNVTAVASASEAVRESDVLICATISRSPVFPAEWLKAGAHVNTIGPKFENAHELDVAVAARSSVIASDSLAQIDAYTQRFFLHGTPQRDRIRDLSEIVAGTREGRTSPADITLFCSVGLAGTEVVLANEVIRRAGIVLQ
ncbi:MAG TPA: ornithine cyclodeaminase family protein [Gammaproteobacteria bacterium]|nr:ornithine cyclodeaminase family protein [Gammaproteobacteria bacterium]